MVDSYSDKMKEAIKSCHTKGINPVLLAKRISEEEREKKAIVYKNERLQGVEKNITTFLKNRPDLNREY